MSEPKEMSTEMRSLVAAILCLLVIGAWSLIYKPPQPSNPIHPAPAPVTQHLPSSAGPAPPAVAAAPAPPAEMHAAGQEQPIIVQSNLYRVELSNRGAVVHSWQLRKYNDDANPPRTLDVVHADAAKSGGSWPFSLTLDDPQQESSINNALFEVDSHGAAVAPGTVLQVPVTIDFLWSDGHLQVKKTFTFDDSYIAKVRSSVTLDGEPTRADIAWLGGFGDPAAYRAALQMLVFNSAGGKVSTLAAKNLGQSGHSSLRNTVSGPFDFTGIEDLYFAAAFLPPTNAQGVVGNEPFQLQHWTLQQSTTGPDGKVETEAVPEMATGIPTPGPLDLRIYVGPKEIDTLKAVSPPLNGLVQFGWFGIISEPLFYGLRWLYRYVPNYGWGIVLITIAINMVLFPLKAISMRAAQKMQKAAPEVKAIQERYKKYSMRDPRKAEMNKEMMAVYSREGINPMGSCWPMVVQFPIWYAFYRMLANTIDLRQAPWFGWIHDLSARDPYFILPIFTAITMYYMQKMLPTPGVDPAQARMMTVTMPLIFGAMFAFYPSGLALYILTSNFVGMSQQWYLYRKMPPPPKPSRGPGKKR